jgi:hypothetical protein
VKEAFCRTTNILEEHFARADCLLEFLIILPLETHGASSLQNMDVVVLRGRIEATLDADADVRRRAELDLKTVSRPIFQTLEAHVDSMLQGGRASWFHRRTARYSSSRAGSSHTAFE